MSRTMTKGVQIIVFALILAFVPTAAARVIYVDDSAVGANDGSSWADAYTYLQDALRAASAGDEIRVAQGVYKPDQTILLIPSLGRASTFQLKNGMAVKGGYAGIGAPDPDARDIHNYETILSGDLSGNDIEVADPAELLGEPTRSENSYNVVNASGCDRTTLLEGFTITGGNANATMLSGGGIINGKPTVSQCKIVANSAASSGGGIYFDHSAHAPGALLKDSTVSHNAANSGGGIYNCAEIINCIISGNLAQDGPGGGVDFGSDCETSVTDCIISNNSAAENAGGVFISFSGSEVIFTRCSFIGNSAGYKGGATYADGCTCGSYSTFYQCKFIANSAAGNGGAISDYGFTDMQLYSCLLVGNSSGGNGGALCDEYDGGSALINCTVANNTAAGQGGAVCYDDYSYKGRRLANTIIWGNSDRNGQTHQYSQIYLIEVSELQAVSRCCIQVIPPEIEGQGNITSNPLFVDIDGPDNIPGNEDDNLHLLDGSPCVDTGNNSYAALCRFDLDGKPRIINSIVDIGAYESGRLAPAIIYVDIRATGANNGSSWKDAFSYLQDALRVANSGTEIHVAQGTYKPDQTILMIPSLGRASTFQLKNGVAIKGGYAGVHAPDPDARDIHTYETILSGDLAGNDINVNDPENLGREPTRGENSYRVVTGSGTNATAIIDGFTITAGNANYDDFSQCNGAGMFNEHGSPTVLNCTFTGNFAGNNDGGGLGGGMYNYNGSPTLTNCRFIQNCAIALDGGEGAGGAIGNWDSSPTLTNCIFTGNIAGHDGGGMWSYESNPVLVNCFFSGNLAREGGSGSYGGGMWSYDGSASLINCTFTANTARSSQIGQAGGGLYAEYLTELTLTNCIFWGNTSDGVSEEAAQICIMNGAVNINYGCVQGWTGELGGIANIGDNPLFVNSGDGDYHLQPDSPCVDTGDNSAVPQSVTTDLDGNPRIVNGTVDMGAYELGVMRIIYVDDTARGANNGSSWADAYNYLQDALRVATSGTEIRIAQGTYKPDQTTNFRSPRGDRAATFRLKNGVTIKGGYAGFGAPIPDARDIERFKTILSGDLNGDDRNTVEPYNLPREPSRMDNSLHVVTASGTNKSAILDGVTITAGHANDYIDDLINGEYGGGMYNKGGSPTIKNCTFLRNSAFAVEYSAGGGLYNEDGSPILINCRFIHNAADASIRDHGGGDGGAIAEHDSNSILIDCTFIANVAAGNHGGAIYHCGGDPELKGCTFRDNFAQKYGGGLCNWWGKVKLSGCTFVGNTAGSDAGGMYNCGDSSLSNCEFVGNRCRQNGGGFSSDGLNPTIGNCRFTENSAENAGGAIANRVSSPTITKCTFTANTAGFGGGGGIYNRENANPTVSDCTFTRNRALLDYGGGGMCNNASSPRVSNCTFTQNKADDNGGAVSNWYGSSPTFTSCLFVENTARTCGGLHSYENCNPTVIDCKFIRNSTGSSGGAMSIGVNCNATVVNCLFAQNSAGTHAGGLYSYSSNPTLINCTFAANFAPNGSALAFASATNLPVNDAKLANCILWDRGGEIWKGDDSTIAITYSDIKGGWPGMGNINADPLFADPCDGNYHLRPHSPCINKGDNSAVPPSVTFDLDGNERIMFHTVDMGAYEFQGPMIIFVDDDATGANNGSSWKDAYKFLQDALTIASKGCEIRVAQGIYRPDRAIGVPIEHGNRTATFQLKNGVIIKGGYAGVTEPRSDIRDANAYESILSGDLLGNDASMSPIDPTRDNSLHVVTGSETNSTAVLDGFTITAGNANQVNPYLSPYAHGGGMYNEGGSPTVVNCTFTANSAAYFGAGMCNWQGSSPALTNCTFADNSAGNRGGGVYNWSSRPKLNNCTFSNNQARLYGGGLYGEGDSDATITDCIFTGNRTDEAGGGGGAICNNNSDTIIANCIFADNTGKNFGGAIDNQTWSRPKIVNCLFVGNRAGIFGGAIDNCNETRPSIINCTFAENLAPAARAVGCYGEPPTGPSNVQLTNCILRDGGDEIANKDNSTVTVTYSDIKGGWSGEGNIDADPVFADPCDGNYHIRPRSPCINTGNNSAIPPLVRTDLDGRPRIIGRRIDMGCYEFNHIPVANAGLDQTVYAGPDGTAKVMLDGSTSFDEDGQPLTYKWSWQVGGRTFAAGSGDGIINIRDFAHLAKKWLQPERPFADVETLAGDNRVGPMDLALIAQAWLSTPDSPRWDPRLDIAPPGPTPTIILPVGRHVIQLVVNDGIDDSRPDWVVITVLDSMEAGLDIYPPVIMRSDPLPPAILTILYLPPGVTADQVDAELPLLLYPGRIESMSQYVFETDMDGTIITTIFGFFDKTRLLRAVSENGNIELRVTGRLKTGQSFCGCDTVMIID